MAADALTGAVVDGNGHPGPALSQGHGLAHVGAHHADKGARFSGLKRWAMEVARRRGMKRAKVALARKLVVVLHRMWSDGTDFRWGKDVAAA
jgi:hypothetical protein